MLRVLSLIVGVIGIIFGVIERWRRRELEKYIRAPRLELVENTMSRKLPSHYRGTESDATALAAFQYQATLKNQGERPVHIDLISLQYANLSDKEQRERKVISRNFYLTPDEPVEIEGSIAVADVLALADQHTFSEDDCGYSLYLRYFTIDGQPREVLRDYGGGTHFVSRAGAILVPPRRDTSFIRRKSERIFGRVRDWTQAVRNWIRR